MLRLKEERKNHKMTQEQVAQVVGLTRGAYANVENGKRQCDIEVYVPLADLYGVSIDYLIGRSAEKKSSINSPLHEKKKLIATRLDAMSDDQYALVLAYISGVIDESKKHTNQ